MLEKVKEGDIVLLSVPSKKLIEINTKLLKEYITKKNYDVVYVTVNKPFSDLIENFKREKINTNKIFIIDAVTPQELINPIRTENAVFVGSPKVLTNISITTISAIERIKTAKMLIFDSISTLLIYNDFEIVKEFIHFITTKLKELKITVIMNCIKEMNNKETLAQLNAFADEIINIE